MSVYAVDSSYDLNAHETASQTLAYTEEVLALHEAKRLNLDF